MCNANHCLLLIWLEKENLSSLCFTSLSDYFRKHPASLHVSMEWSPLQIWTFPGESRYSRDVNAVSSIQIFMSSEHWVVLVWNQFAEIFFRTVARHSKFFVFFPFVLRSVRKLTIATRIAYKIRCYSIRMNYEFDFVRDYGLVNS